VTPPAAPRDSIDRFLPQVGETFPTLDLEVEAAVDRVHVLHKHLHQMIETGAARFGLRAGEFEVLTKLRLAEEGRLSPGELSQRTLLSTGAMTNRLNNLEEAGLVTRERDPGDRRGVLVVLTQQGRDKIDVVVDAMGAQERAILSALTPDEQRKLNGLLRKLLVAVEADKRPS